MPPLEGLLCGSRNVDVANSNHSPVISRVLIGSGSARALAPTFPPVAERVKSQEFYYI